MGHLNRAGYKVTSDPARRKQAGEHAADLAFRLERRGMQFEMVLHVRASGSPSEIYETIGRSAVARSQGRKEAVWVFVAPYISPKAAELCRAAGLSYADDAGNCEIQVGETHLRIDTGRKPPRVRRVQRALFSNKAARVSLALLLEPNREWVQRALASEIKVSIGLVSRTIQALSDQGWVGRGSVGWTLTDREGLLGAWAEEYGRRKPEARGYFSRSSLADLEEMLDRGAAEGKYQYALTAESGAKYRAPLANEARLVFYTDRPEKVVEHLGLKSVETGANVVLLLPRDPSVFHKMRREAVGDPASGGGRYITNDVHLYLDLVTSPARGKEQADHLMSVLAGKGRTRTTAEEARIQGFLSKRDAICEASRHEKWDEVIEAWAAVRRDLEGVPTEDVAGEVAVCRRIFWQALLESARAAWGRPRGGWAGRIARVSKEIPSDQEVLDAYPPHRVPHAHIRYLLGLRHAILALHLAGQGRTRHAGIAREHLMLAMSRHTNGADAVAGRVEDLRRWLREAADLELVF